MNHNSGAIPAERPRMVGLVGHCSPDSFMLINVLRQVDPSAKVERINDDGTLFRRLAGFDLLLVNRALDGEFSFNNGVEAIAHITQIANHPLTMLVSNFEEAQAAAVAAGALPGFGKSEIGTAATRSKLREALARPQADALGTDQSLDQ